MKENNLNEDFIPFELAVKLKEKGFDSPCIYAYCEQGGWNRYRQVHEPITHILRTDGNPFGSFYRGKNWNIKYETNKNKIRCSAPTIAQVLKWLREEKDIDLVIYPIFLYEEENRVKEYSYKIYAPQLNKPICGQYHKCYEFVLLTSIKYVLDNLI